MGNLRLRDEKVTTIGRAGCCMGQRINDDHAACPNRRVNVGLIEYAAQSSDRDLRLFGTIAVSNCIARAT